MALMVPVLALAKAALPETIAGAGLLLEKDDPALVAAAMEEILTESSRQQYARDGFTKYQNEYSGEKQERLFSEIMQNILAAL
jgi:glycosyltransferase involved in cell wall biosynthesis